MKKLKFLLIIPVLVSCLKQHPANIQFNPSIGDTMAYTFYSNQKTTLSASNHGADIDRSMEFRLLVIPGLLKNRQWQFALIPEQIAMKQEMPGSGLNQFDTDHPDSSSGSSADMLQQNFMKYLGLKSTITCDSLGTEYQNNFIEVLENAGSSELSDFIKNHPFIMPLDNGSFYKGKKWNINGKFNEAGIYFDSEIQYQIDSIANQIWFISAVRELKLDKGEKSFEVEFTADIQGKVEVDGPTGMVRLQNWKENITLDITKAGKKVPVRIIRDCGFRLSN